MKELCPFMKEGSNCARGLASPSTPRCVSPLHVQRTDQSQWNEADVRQCPGHKQSLTWRAGNSGREVLLMNTYMILLLKMEESKSNEVKVRPTWPAQHRELISSSPQDLLQPCRRRRCWPGNWYLCRSVLVWTRNRGDKLDFSPEPQRDPLKRFYL